MDFFKLYNEYLHTMNSEDEHLFDLVTQYEDDGLFDDMRLLPSSIVKPFICFEEEDSEGNTAIGYDTDNLYLSIADHYWRFYVRNMTVDDITTVGCTYHDEHKVEIDTRFKSDATVVLHEMIHVYECILETSVNQHYRDIIAFALYNDLSNKIDDLFDRIVSHSHTISNNQVLLSGGEHGILFYLKSLDLDLRLRLPLGTIMGYGRDN